MTRSLGTAHRLCAGTLLLLSTLVLPPAASAQQPRDDASVVRANLLSPIVSLQTSVPPIGADEFTARRDKLAARLPDGVLLALGAVEPRQDYLPFFQHSTFRYLTGVVEPEAALLMVVENSRATQSALFVLPNDPAREVWSGRRLGPEGARSALRINGRPREQLEGVVDSLLTAGRALHVVGDFNARPLRATEHDQFLADLKARHPLATITSVANRVADLRAYKSAAELALLGRSTAITVAAHAAVASTVAAGRFEYEVQAVAEQEFRRHGAERPAFASIVGSGPNATVLHYNTNNRQLQSSDMVVVDIGASVEGYAADMTRSYPVSGRFSQQQRAIYQIVRDAQRAAEHVAVIGTPARRMNEAASATLARGLAALGLIDSVGATYDCGSDGARQCPQLSLYYLHGLGHGIGLDVHDPDRYYLEQQLGDGSVFSIEPGLYVRRNLLSLLPDTPRNRALIARLTPVLPAYADIGVRIEDDYLVTAQGLVWLTQSAREADEIEAAMARRPLQP